MLGDLRWVRQLVSTDQHRHGPSYRPAVDGYRGLFVVLVIAFHLGVGWLGGGWIGINHFFVFSGFLITMLLIKEHQRHGRVAALRFYRRRARRIVPAMLMLIVMVLGVTAVAPWGDRKQTAGDAAATATFWLNWRLVERDDQYFDMFSEPSPLRHAWTLAVEEQFYLLVPFLVMGVMWASRRRWQAVVIVLGLAGLAALWSHYLAGRELNAARLYYGTDVRAQALLVGVAAAFFFTRDRRGRKPYLPRHVAHAFGWVGTLVSLSAFVLLEETSFGVFGNGGMLLFAVMAALMGMSALDSRPMLLNRVMSTPPLVHLGQISYGLYLFHWPLALWAKHLSLPPAATAVGVFAVSWVLAVLSYRLVELPVMTGWAARRVRRRGLHPVAVGTSAAAVVTAAALVVGTRVPAIAEQPWDGRPLDTSATWQRPAEPLTVAVVGDSIPASLLEGFRPEDYPGLRVLEHAEPAGCGATPVTLQLLDEKVPDAPNCPEWRKTWPRQVAAEDADVVLAPAGLRFLLPQIVDGRPVEPRSEQLRDLLEADLDALRRQTQRSGADELQVLNVPCRTLDAGDQTIDDLAAMREQLGASGSALELDPTWANGVIDDWAARQSGARPRVRVLDIDSQLCPDGEHRRVVNGALVYKEGVHFSTEGGALVWSWLAPTIARTHFG